MLQLWQPTGRYGDRLPFADEGAEVPGAAGILGSLLLLTSLGDETCRPQYRELLVDFLAKLELDEDTRNFRDTLNRSETGDSPEDIETAESLIQAAPPDQQGLGLRRYWDKREEREREEAMTP